MKTSRSRMQSLVLRYRNWRGGMSEGQFATVRAAVIVGVVVVVGAGVYFVVQPAWRNWRHKQALTQAIDYAEKQDYRNTMLALKRATELAPLDLATWRDVSKQLAELGSPEAIVARENVVRLAPGDMSMRLALVTEALRFGQVDVAHSALEAVDNAAQMDAGFHRLAAAVAMATGENAELEAHLEALVKAEPNEVLARFNLAALRVWSADPAKQAAGVADLEKLTAAPEVRVRASLELLKHAARIRDAARAGQVVTLLLDQMNVPVTLRGNADGAPAGWFALIVALQETAVKSGPADVALVARWLADVRLRREALVWLDTLPPTLRNAPQVLRVNTSLSAELEDFDRLEPLLRAGGLGPLSVDGARLAITSRIQAVRYQPTRGRATWEDAITACGDSVGALTTLAALAEIWRDPEGGERALQEILRRQPKANWVYLSLRNGYVARGETVKLWQLYGVWLNVRPDEQAYVRTWLHLGAVLDRLDQNSTTLAARRANAEPATPQDVALAAAVKWRGGRMEDALTLLDKLPKLQGAPAPSAAVSPVGDRTPDDVSRAQPRPKPQPEPAVPIDPTVEFWRAVILSDSVLPERIAQARAALPLAQRAGLSPEEAALLEKAAAKLAKRP